MKNRTQFNVWVMFENFTFEKLTGSLDNLQKQIANMYQQHGSKIKGWGRVTLDGITSDEFHMFSGLNSKEDLIKLDKINWIEEVRKQIRRVEDKMIVPKRQLQNLAIVKSKLERKLQ